jgi:adenine deaminase
LKGGTVVNVFSGTLIKGDVAIVGDTIVGIGQYSGITEYDCRGKYITPGFIDTHVHIESSMCSPREFVRTVLANGTTTIIADPHEIANVCGMAGVNYIIEELKKTPINARVMLPSCVPATPLESSGAIIDNKTVSQNITKETIHGLGEFMDFSGVINNDPECIAKIEAAHKSGKIIDGHCIGLNANEHNTYTVTGIKTNHENINPESMLADIERGMYVQMRQGCYGKNIAALVKGLTPRNMRRVMFCTDDKHISQIIDEGHINHNIATTVKNGIDPIDAITIATLNAAECYGLKNRGAIAPSYIADICVINNLRDFKVERVFTNGKLAAQNGQSLYTTTKPAIMNNSIKIKNITLDTFKKFRPDIAIKFTPTQIITTTGTPSTNPNKIAVIERHKATGNVGVALIDGFELKSGAIAQTIAHDSHNIIVVGVGDRDMAYAVEELIAQGGGIVIARGGEVIERMPMPIGGIMSDRSGEWVDAKLTALHEVAHRELGISTDVEPIMTLCFMSLAVIPEIKLTDMGLFDVTEFGFIDIEAE